MPKSNWESRLKDAIQRDVFLFKKDENITHGVKYNISPPIQFDDLSGDGSPVSDIEKKYKGWLVPNNSTTRETIKTLKRYVCEKINETYIGDECPTLTLFNHPNFAHETVPCFSICEKKYNQPNSKPLCLRTWVFNNIHKTDGKFNKNVCLQPWYDMSNRKRLSLSKVCGKITSVYMLPTEE